MEKRLRIYRSCRSGVGTRANRAVPGWRAAPACSARRRGSRRCRTPPGSPLGTPRYLPLSGLGTHTWQHFCQNLDFQAWKTRLPLKELKLQQTLATWEIRLQKEKNLQFRKPQSTQRCARRWSCFATRDTCAALRSAGSWAPSAQDCSAPRTFKQVFPSVCLTSLTIPNSTRWPAKKGFCRNAHINMH